MHAGDRDAEQLPRGGVGGAAGQLPARGLPAHGHVLDAAVPHAGAEGGERVLAAVGAGRVDGRGRRGRHRRVPVGDEFVDECAVPRGGGGEQGSQAPGDDGAAGGGCASAEWDSESGGESVLEGS